MGVFLLSHLAINVIRGPGRMSDAEAEPLCAGMALIRRRQPLYERLTAIGGMLKLDRLEPLAECRHQNRVSWRLVGQANGLALD